MDKPESNGAAEQASGSLERAGSVLTEKSWLVLARYWGFGERTSLLCSTTAALCTISTPAPNAPHELPPTKTP